MSLERLTWGQTLSRLRADRSRLRAHLAGRRTGTSPVLYRISNHLFRAGHRYSARFFWHLNLLLTGADISPPSDLGEGLVIVSPAGVAIMGKAGRNLTMMPLAGLGGELGRHGDVGAGPGLPVLGDDVFMDVHTGVLGPVRIGNRVHVAAGICVVKDVPDDTRVEAAQGRFLRRQDVQ